MDDLTTQKTADIISATARAQAIAPTCGLPGLHGEACSLELGHSGPCDEDF